jgi:hypothetical protein
MDSLEIRKYHLIEQVMHFNEVELNNLEAYLEERKLDSELEAMLTARALQSEQDIKEGKIFTIEEAKARITEPCAGGLSY